MSLVRTILNHFALRFLTGMSAKTLLKSLEYILEGSCDLKRRRCSIVNFYHFFAR